MEKVIDLINSDQRIKCIPATYNIKQILEQSSCMLSFFTIPHANLAMAESIIAGTPVIAADTIVVIDNVILGKPQDAAAAKAMLQCLSGRTHQVITGVAVRYKGQQLSKVCVTDVSFRQLTAEEIDAYIATGEPMDKAGAYGIQGRGAVLVEKINGCYNNVVGLPLSLLYLMMQRLGV